jgi:hypothetical protein
MGEYSFRNGSGEIIRYNLYVTGRQFPYEVIFSFEGLNKDLQCAMYGQHPLRDPIRDRTGIDNLADSYARR